MTLAEKLKKARADQGIDLSSASASTDCTVLELENYETAAAKPRPAVLHRLCSFYGLVYPEMMVLAGYLLPKKEFEVDLAIVERVRQVIRTIMCFESTRAILLTDRLEMDLTCTRMDFVEIICALDDSFDVCIEDDDMHGIVSVADAVATVQKLIKKP